MVEWLEQSPTGLKVGQRIVAQAEPIHAPHLIDIEVAHSIRRHVRLGSVTEKRGQQALWDLLHAPCIRHEHYPFLQRLWQLRDNVSPYDAVYIALAEFLGARLLTCDGKLAGAPGHGASMELIS
jgi:predicted nucleic acid-binding protein